MDSKELADYFEINERTVRYWLKHGMPVYAVKYLQMRAGEHKDWRGIRFLDGLIHTSNGYTFNRNQLETLIWTVEITKHSSDLKSFELEVYRSAFDEYVTDNNSLAEQVLERLEQLKRKSVASNDAQPRLYRNNLHNY